MQTIDRPASLFDHLDDADPADLLRGVAAGRPGAWTELVRTYTPLLQARARRYRLQDADTLDAIQTTWVRLAENIHRIHTPEHLAGWLATVVSRECLRTLRRDSRTVSADEWFLARPDDRAGPESLAVDAAAAADLRSAMAELPAQRRSLLEALFAEDRKPYAEIAGDLGMPIGSLGPTRARSLLELRRLLECRGVHG